MVGKNSSVSRANHKTNKRMSIFRYTQVRSYKTVPNDFFVELKRYFVTQGFKIKRFSYTETSGQMVGRKDGWHLNFVPKFILDIKQVNGVHFITFNYFARVRKIGIATGIATQGITAIVGAATITGYLAAARNLVDAVGKAMDVLAGDPLSVEWLEKEEAGEDKNTTNSQTVTYNTTNIQNLPTAVEPVSNTRETVVEHHHHYYYGGAQGEFAQPVPPQIAPVQAPVEEPIRVETAKPLAIMPAEPSQPFYKQSDLEKELINMYERGDMAMNGSSMPASSDPFSGGSEASAYAGSAYDMPEPHYFSGGAMSSAQAAAPSHDLFAYEDQPLPQYNLPAQHAPLYSIEPLSYKQNGNNFQLDELRNIQPVQTVNPFIEQHSVAPSKPQTYDPFADLSIDNVVGAYGMKKEAHHHVGDNNAQYHGVASR